MCKHTAAAARGGLGACPRISLRSAVIIESFSPGVTSYGITKSSLDLVHFWLYNMRYMHTQ